MTSVQTVAVRPGRHLDRPDQIVTEEPMEIRAAGPREVPVAVAVTMRTPGSDFELAAGFLCTEGLVASGDIAAVDYCEAVEADEQRFNVVTVHLRVPFVAPTGRRAFTINASCGICGKASLDEIALRCAEVPAAPRVASSVVGALPARLRQAQRLFERTGGLHAAGAFGADGSPVSVREDVGRHNAVDKVIGHAALNGGLPVRAPVLAVSGRASFEIVQKAAMGGFAIIVAVSAPSSLAVEAAQRLGVALAGFVRDGSYNLYAHPERIDLDA